MTDMSGSRRVTAMILGAPFTRRAWRDLAYCVAGAVTGVAGFIVVVVILGPGLVISGSVVGTVAGLLLVVCVLAIARGLGALHRRLLRLATGERVPAPAPFRPGTGPLGRLDRRLRDREGWRAVGYVLVKFGVAIVQGYAAVAAGMGLVDLSYPLAWLLFRNHRPGVTLRPLRAVAPVPHGQLAIATWPGTFAGALLGAACVLAGVWLARAITTADSRLIRFLLGPSRVSELERTRAIAVEEAMAALRRVERDLHDGAQVRLAAVAMNLGMAREKVSDEAASELIDAAQTGVTDALADLRRIARGIHPPVLDSGLADALASLTAASPIPVTVDEDLPARPSRAIETIAYFCVAELLANAIKHSSANTIEIKIDTTERGGVLRLRITDDGLGGADSSRGTGLDGLAQRASTVDGSLVMSSPPGGPTAVTVELPMSIRGGGA